MTAAQIDAPVILGAGPAGLTAGYVLARAGADPVVLEAMPVVGGLARTEVRDGYRFDLGGHRFFTKVAEVERLWHEVLGDEFLLRPRLSRIYTDRLHDRFRSLVHIERLGHFIDDVGADPGDPGDPYFLSVGRLETIKGFDRLIEAFRRRPSQRLLIAGTGTQDRSLRHAARDLPNVRFLGWVSQTALDALYRLALALIVPTRGHESFPLVLLEAFVRGRPAIVHRFGALAELAHESGAALMYSSQEELITAIDRLANEAELRDELGARARAAYLDRWTPEKHLACYFGLIARLAEARGDSELVAAATGPRA